MNIFGKRLVGLIYWPIFGSFFLIVWTAILAPYTSYGDYWAIVAAVPVFLVLPITLFIHIVLIINGKCKVRLVLYGLIHIPLQLNLWIIGLTLVTKDFL